MATAAWPASRRTRRFTTLADKYMGKRFNSPNDGVFKSNGDLYFTDPPYGLLKLNADPAKELEFNGVYRISAADGTVTLLTKEMTFPNGIAFSPDEKTLYVANSDPKKAIWMAFPVKDDGTIGAGRVFADVTSSVADQERAARRHEGRRGRQPVRDRAGRRLGLRAGRHPPRHLHHRRGHGQLRLGRGRLGPLYHGRHVYRPRPAHDQGKRILNCKPSVHSSLRGEADHARGKLKVYSDDRDSRRGSRPTGSTAGPSKTAGSGASTTPTAGRRR